MPVIDDVTVVGFDTEEENRLSYKAIRARVSTARTASIRGGSDRAIAKHRSRGKLTARERIDVLLDVESPFFEIGQIAAYEVYDDSVPSAALVTGIGTVRGSLCAISPTTRPSKVAPTTR